MFIKARKEKRREALSGQDLMDIMNSLPRLRDDDRIVNRKERRPSYMTAAMTAGYKRLPFLLILLYLRFCNESNFDAVDGESMKF